MTKEPMVHICGPDWVWEFGPLEITFHHLLGVTFYLGKIALYPRRFSPLWLVFSIVRRMKEVKK